MKRFFGIFIFLLIAGTLSAETQADIFSEGAISSYEKQLDSEKNYSAADFGEIRNLEAEKIYEIEKMQTVISVRSNVQGAAVFLNNEYQGTVPLNISGLAAGIYELRLEKQGYSNSAYMIYVSEGRSFSYYVPLERSIGFLVFSSLIQKKLTIRILKLKKAGMRFLSEDSDLKMYAVPFLSAKEQCALFPRK